MLIVVLFCGLRRCLETNRKRRSIEFEDYLRHVRFKEEKRTRKKERMKIKKHLLMERFEKQRQEIHRTKSFPLEGVLDKVGSHQGRVEV